MTTCAGRKAGRLFQYPNSLLSKSPRVVVTTCTLSLYGRLFVLSVCLVCVVDRVEIQCHTSVRLIRYALLVNC